MKEKVEQLNDAVLPKGVKIVPFYDRTWLIDKTLHDGVHQPGRRARCW